MCLKYFRKKPIIPVNPGALKSPADSRDLPLSAFRTELRELPEKFIIPYKLPVTNQGNTPACVGFSSALMKGEKERREQNPVDFDGSWIYKQCKKIDDMPNIEGTYLRSALKILQKQGAKPLNQENTDESEWLKYRIGAYAKLDDNTFEGIKSAIYQFGVLIAGFYGTNEGWATKHIRPPKSGERQWGHAIPFIGFNKDYLIFQNSWGDWGNKGLGYAPKNYLPFESWAVLSDWPTFGDFELNEKPKHCFKENLRYGMENEDIKKLQECLKFKGIFPNAIKCSGKFGQLTLASVRHFQDKHKQRISEIVKYEIRCTGFVGPGTRNKLNSIFCEK